jgi:hypothetical protein
MGACNLIFFLRKSQKEGRKKVPDVHDLEKPLSNSQ